MGRTQRWYDYITINIYYLGLTTLSQTNGLVFPLLVQQFVGESGKATFFGTLRLWTFVITSYSIHYTKLYESQVRKSRFLTYRSQRTKKDLFM